jgi:hypothetical protein
MNEVAHKKSIDEILEILGPFKSLATEMHAEDARFFDSICTYLSFSPMQGSQILIDLDILKEVIELLKEKVHLNAYLNYLMEAMNQQDELALKLWRDELKPKYIGRKFSNLVKPGGDHAKTRLSTNSSKGA